MSGVFIWEYLSTIWFEWSFISRKRRYRWSIWVYGAMRLATLLNVLDNLLESNIRRTIDCQFWVHSEYITAYAAFVLSSFIMVLKIAAIWNRNKWVLLPSMAAWLTNLAFVIRCIATISAQWDHNIGTCVLDKEAGQMTLDSTLTTISSELFLLFVMLTGLVRERDHCLGRLLFNQGLIWLVVAMFAQVPLLVVLILKLNDLADLMFHSISLLSTTICVTRMYRGLSNYRCTPKSPSNPTIKTPIAFASFYSTDQSVRLPSPTLKRATISFQGLERSETSDSTPREVKFPTISMFRGPEAV
ncbi:hypothetical protein BJV74DRAFT_146920 [Russula compacta]|nr:hypothetical protein BJV74DRAFT_146920 [Russula compacta]